MAPEDVDAVASLEAHAFSSPWSADTFRSLLDRPGAELHVLDAAGVVVGYAVLWRMLDQGELVNLAVAEGRRGRGLGGSLLDHVLDAARGHGVRTLVLEVRDTNEAARRLYGSRGFREIGRRKGYYTEPREDARVLAIRL